MTDIDVKQNAAVQGGPVVDGSGPVTVEAYSKINVTIAAAAADVEVEVQPTAADRVNLLVITAGAYSADLTYKVGANTGTPVALDAPQFFNGAGMMSMLEADPNSLFFSNAGAEDVPVTILVGRDATP